MIRSVAKVTINTLFPIRSMSIQPALLSSFQLTQTAQLSSKITFGFTTKDDKGKKQQKEKPKQKKQEKKENKEKKDPKDNKQKKK